MSRRPTGYPLPWCQPLDRAYWEVNLLLIATRDGWRKQQCGRDMDAIIPMIDELLEALGPDFDPDRGPFLHPDWL